MSGMVRLILVAGIVGLLVAANMAMMPGEHGNLPPRPAPHVPEAAVPEWSLFERTEAAHTTSPRYAEELRTYDGKEVSLFGYVTLSRDGLDVESNRVTSFFLSPGFHYLCCGTSGSNPVTQLRPETTVLIKSDEAHVWIRPEAPRSSLFVDAVGTLRLIAEADDKPIYRLEDARLAFYVLDEDETWQRHTIQYGAGNE